jgi:hypothetical protein
MNQLRMKNGIRTILLVRAAFLASLAMGLGALGCGGSSEAPTAPVAVSSPTPAPTPAATPAPAVGYPDHPTLLAPADGAVLDSYPRTVTLEWAAVSDLSGVRYYRVEIDLGYPSSPDWDRIPDQSGYYGSCVGQITRTSCTTFGFPGAQPGRWRVIVANGNRNETASVWRTFRFTR